MDVFGTSSLSYSLHEEKRDGQKVISNTKYKCLKLLINIWKFVCYSMKCFHFSRIIYKFFKLWLRGHHFTIVYFDLKFNGKIETKLENCDQISVQMNMSIIETGKLKKHFGWFNSLVIIKFSLSPDTTRCLDSKLEALCL
jgi:hypothetical protein